MAGTPGVFRLRVPAAAALALLLIGATAATSRAHSIGADAWSPGNGPVVPAADIERDIAVHDTIHIGHCRVQGMLHLDAERAPQRLEATDVMFEDGIDATDQTGRFYFYDSRFLGPVELTTSRCDVVRFEHCRFEDDADFHSLSSVFFWVRRCTFTGHANFVGIRVRHRPGDPWLGTFNMSDAHFSKSVDFAGSEMEQVLTSRNRANEPIQITWKQFGEPWLREYLAYLDTLSDGRLNRSSYYSALISELEFWKRNFVHLDSRADADEANFARIRVERSRMLSPWKPEWWLSWIGELPNRYGTRPYRPLWTGLVIIVAFTILYWRLDPFEQAAKHETPRSRRPRFLFALLYSLETFVPFLDVTGVRSWGWVVTSRFRWLELAERLMGLFLSALAAYGIGTRLS